MAIIQCPTCSGRGWLPKLSRPVRKALAAMHVIDISTARFMGYKEQCPKCLGRCRVLSEVNPYYGKQRKK